MPEKSLRKRIAELEARVAALEAEVHYLSGLSTSIRVIPPASPDPGPYPFVPLLQWSRQGTAKPLPPLPEIYCETPHA